MKVKVFKRRGKWHIGYRPEGAYGPYIRRVMPDKRTAERVARKIEVEVMEGTYIDRKRVARSSFGTVAKQYLDFAARTKRDGGQRDRVCFRALSSFHRTRMADITVRSIEEHVAARIDAGLSPQTVNHELQFLRNVFSRAIEWGEATGNPAAAVKKLATRNTRLRYLSDDEEARLLAHLAPHLVPIVTVALYTGMRESEVLGLTWSDIDLDNGIVHLDDTKNERRRDIPMAAVVRATLRAQPRHIRSPYVFCKVTGKPYGRVDKGMRGACSRAKLDDVVFHTLRHTFASRLVMRGVDLKTVMELLGHSSLAMVMRYAHLSPEHRRRAISALDERPIEHEGEQKVNPSENR